MSGSRKVQRVQTPKAVRMPVTDGGPVRPFASKTMPEIQQRQGASSTVLSDILKSVTGSIGLLGR